MVKYGNHAILYFRIPFIHHNIELLSPVVKCCYINIHEQTSQSSDILTIINQQLPVYFILVYNILPSTLQVYTIMYI